MRHCLVLNSQYIPIDIVPVRRAVKMLYRGRVEAVENEKGYYVGYDFTNWAELSEYKEQNKVEGEDYFYTGGGSKINAPVIIRTLYFSGIAYTKVSFTRKNIYLRDNYTCAYCGRKMKPEKLNLDHIIPKSRGGRSTWENVVCSCISCNTKKNNLTPHEANMKLLIKPIEPKYNILLNYDIPKKDKYYMKWADFVDKVYWETELEQ